MKRNILVVDDDISILSGFERMLTQSGFSVDTAENAKDALESIGKSNYHVAIVDMVLKDVSGLELIEKIKEINKNITIIVITGYPSKETAIGSLRKGAFEYLEKPCSRKVLLQALNRALSAKKKEEEMESFSVEIDSFIRQKNVFRAQVMHDILSNANVVVGFAKYLAKTPLGNRQKNYIKAILSGGSMICKLSRQVLDFSQIKFSSSRFEEVDFNLESMVIELVKTMYLTVEEKPVTISYEIADTVPRHVKGDPYRLRQILENLFSNSIKFTEEGSICLSVSLKEETKDSCMLVFSVKDTGIGIEPDHIQDIFNPFYKAFQHNQKRGKGAGLGLSICKMLIEKMNGEIRCFSRPGEGSEFVFSVSVSRGAPNLERDISFDQEGVAIKVPQVDTIFKGLRVLVVDDDLASQELMQVNLEDLGCAVSLAGSGQEAIDMLNRDEYGLCFMDMKLPDIDGLETIKRIRSSEKNRSIPILSVSACATEMLKEACSRLGTAGFLSKPVNMERVKEKMVCCVLSQDKKTDASSQLTQERKGNISAITNIGIIAGEIWSRLEESEGILLSDLYDQLDFYDNYIMMSIGWLAREGYISLKESEGGDFEVTLSSKHSKKSF